MTADIRLSSRLVITNGKSVTLDLNGHKLSRSLISAAGDGNVISVETGGQLTVKDSGNDYGQISGGKAINGGGICNHGTLTLEGGTVTDCYASSNGGGIYNAPATAGGTPATLAIKGGQVTTNSCGDRGAGIFNYSGCTLNMQGKVFIAENLKNSQQNNVYLGGESVITVTGALTGSHIGVSIAQTFRNITSGYKAKNPSVDGSTFFRSDNSQIGIVQNGDEVAIGRSAVAYSVRSWNETSKQVETTSSNCFGYTLLEGSHPNDWVGLSDGYYVVKGTVEYKALSITGSEVHLVLCDGATLRCAHVKLEEGHTLHIHSQSDGNLQGKLEVMNRTKDDAYIFKNAAAIGGGNEQSMGNLFIHGGKVTAYGGENGAGIGGGRRGNQGGSVIIYGGNVEAEGGIDAAGIGGGDNYGKGGNGGVVKIYGGHVVAIGGKTDDTEIACSGAGIGAGRDSNGGQVYIYGGEVYAYGGKQAAGVGGSSSGKGGTLEVNGGYLFAAGVYEAPAIGGGSNGAGGTVIINGGTVCAAKGGRYVKIIGGYYRYDSGLLKLASGMRVLCGNADDAVSNPAHREKSHLTPVEFENQRREVCQSHSYTCVLIESCPHQTNRTYTYMDEKQHAAVCKQCAHYDAENHTYTDGKCVCGKKYDGTESTYTITIHTTTDGKTYASKEQKVIKGKEFTLPVPEAQSGLTFMGYLKAASADGIEMKDSEKETLLADGTAVTPDADAHYYARYRYDYYDEWTWNDERTEATVTITNALINDTQTLKATVTEDTETKVEPTETTLGERYFNAIASYTRATGITYQFEDRETLVFFAEPNPEVTLDTQSKDGANTKTLEKYLEMKADVTINNLTLKKDGKIHPISLPFSVSTTNDTPLKGAVIYQLSGVQMKDNHEYAMTFKQVTATEAGAPCFYRFKETGGDVQNPVFKNVVIEEYSGSLAEKEYDASTWSADDETLELWGSFEPEAIDEVNRELYFLMDGDGISLKPESLGAFSSYFYIASPLDEQGYNRVRSVSLTFESDRFSKKLTYSWDGDGSEAQPYIISSPEQLNEMQEELNGSNGASLEGKYFRQGANIKFDKTVTNNYTPVKTFKGHYDGAGYTIGGLNINTPAANAGLFIDVADGSTVQNVIIADASISGAAAGGIANQLLGSSMIDNCHVLKDVSIAATNSTVASNVSAGGIVACMTDGSPVVTNCTSHATLSSAVGYAGGIVGTLGKGSLANCIYLGGKPTTHDDNFWSAITFDFSDGNATVEDCYFTNPTLKDGKALVMPQYDKDVDNTDFLTLLTMRDRFLTGTSGLTREQIGYDITLNKRATLSAEQNADGTWKSKAYSVCLPFSVSLRQQFDDDAPVVIDHVAVYKPHRLDNGIFSKELIFTGVFPELKAGEAYIVVVKKGSVSLSAKNATVVDTPAEADKVVSESDISEQIGEWSGTFERIDDDEMTTRCLYIAQKDKTFKRATLFTNSWINPFTGYFAPLEAYIISFLNHRTIGVKYVPTGQGDGDEEGEVTDFPADEFDSDNELPDDETGIGTVTVSGDNSDRYYDLQGRQINSKPAKGVYIKDGKKVVIK